MKRAKKKILGLFGLALVVATTIFAASLPGPEASATEMGSVTDTITVRVVGDYPDVNILSPENKTVFVTPNQSIEIEYQDVETVKVTLQYTDKEGEVHDYEIDNLTPDYYAGSKTYEIDLAGENYGFGEYVLTVEGVGFDKIPDPDIVKFYYYPVYAEITEDEDSGLVYADLHYDKDSEVDTIEINVYDENGNLVTQFSPIKVKNPTTRVELPFSEYKELESGNYKIEIIPYTEEGEMIYKPIFLYYYYDKIPVPDTGGLFQNLNISQKDYLITGLIIFFIAAVTGLIFIGSRKNKRTRLGHKRK